MKIIDTHAHLVCNQIYPIVDEVIARAKEKNVEKILCIATSKDELDKAIQLQLKYPMIDIAFGMHPADLDKVKEEDYIELEKAIQEKKIIAVGEIGLDYHWNVVSKEEQSQAFIRQIKLANQYHLPILIHMREATKDCVDILKQHSKTGGIMHCYSGSVETARELIKIGFYISFGGILTFKNANQLVEVAQKLPSNRIFVETDCPYLAPVPYRGKQNEVSYIHATFEFLCQLRNEDLSEQLILNYQELFYGKN